MERHIGKRCVSLPKKQNKNKMQIALLGDLTNPVPHVQVNKRLDDVGSIRQGLFGRNFRNVINEPHGIPAVIVREVTLKIIKKSGNE